MKKRKIILLCIAGAFVILLAVVVIKALTFTSRQIHFDEVVIPHVDVNAAAKRLSQAIQCQTVSYEDRTQIDYVPFLEFQEYLEQAFPLIHSNMEKKVINSYAILYTWQGTAENLKPILIYGHHDVVPAADNSGEAWKYQPFSGAIAEGYVWGRGALDTKSSIMGALEAVETLLKEGFSPRRTVYIASGFDEEIGGQQGAKKIAEYLKSNGVVLEYTLDEGSVISHGIVTGIKAPVALIGIAEKGYVTLEFYVEGQAGHSSMPPKQTSIGVLSAAIAKLEANPFPATMSGPTGKLFDHLGREMPFFYKMLFASRWLFWPVLKSQLASFPAGNASIRTTTAATMFDAGVKSNVLPSGASATVNFRILPGDSVQGIMDRVKALINDSRVKISMRKEFVEPSPVSDINSASYLTVYKSIKQVFPDVLVAPALVIATTDSKHFEGIAKNLFRFNPHRLGKDDLSMIHGVNEKISLENYEECIKFYIQLIRNSNE